METDTIIKYIIIILTLPTQQPPHMTLLALPFLYFYGMASIYNLSINPSRNPA